MHQKLFVVVNKYFFKGLKVEYIFRKQPVYKQLASGWQIAKQLWRFNPLTT